MSHGNRPPVGTDTALPTETTATLGETEAVLELAGTGFNDLAV